MLLTYMEQDHWPFKLIIVHTGWQWLFKAGPLLTPEGLSSFFPNSTHWFRMIGTRMSSFSAGGKGLFDREIGPLQSQLHLGEYDLLRLAPMLESDFVQVTGSRLSNYPDCQIVCVLLVMLPQM